MPEPADAPPGLVFNVQEYSVHDGPGIRTTIFLKGCPLRCLWCANPEGQSPHPEPLHGRSRCRRCGTCIRACPQAAVVVGPDDYPRFRRELCVSCVTRDCVRVCPAQAIRVMGEYWLPEDLCRRLAGQIRFYRNSGGGVTLSGGEPLAQPSFAAGIVCGCAELGIHVAVETCGCVPWSALSGIAPHVDLFLYDLKVMDPARHRRCTGISNELALDNLGRLALLRKPIQVRVPLIPGYTDDDENLAAICQYAGRLGLQRIAFLPYNPTTGAKYGWLERDCAVAAVTTQSQEKLEGIRALGQSYGLVVQIGG